MREKIESILEEYLIHEDTTLAANQIFEMFGYLPCVKRRGKGERPIKYDS